MLLIVANHFAMFVQVDCSSFPFNRVLNYFLQTGGKFGVNLFMLITGYFMCKSSFRKEKLYAILSKCVIYSVSCYLLFCLLNREINIKDFMESLFPCITNEYWFITAYVGVYLISPFLNILWETLTHKQKKELILIGTVMISIIPTFTMQEPWTSNFVWLGYLYLVGAYIRTDMDDSIKKSRKLLPLGVVLYFGIALSCLVIEWLSGFIPVFQYHIGHFRNMTSFPLLLASVAFFIWFGNIEFKHEKLVPAVMAMGNSAFSVCLIHENPYIKRFLWGGILCKITPTGIGYFPFAICTSIGIYLCCLIIDTCVNSAIELTKND